MVGWSKEWSTARDSSPLARRHSTTLSASRASGGAPAAGAGCFSSTERSTRAVFAQAHTWASEGIRSPEKRGANQLPASSAPSSRQLRSRRGPLPLVVRSSVSSCSRTGTPSAVRCTSNSTASAPSSSPRASDAIVFSGACAAAPRWPTTRTPIGGGYRDPATRTGLALTLAPGALGRILVGPQSEERRLTELVIGRPLRVGDLRDQLCADRDGVAHAGRRVERRAIDAERLELRRQHRERFAREAGADLADEDQRPPAIEAHQQRTEMLTAAGR